MYVARDSNFTPEGTTGTTCVEDMHCAVRVTVPVPYDSPDDSGVLVTFLSGLGEGAVTSAEKLEITAGRLVPPTADTGKLETWRVHLLCHNLRREDPARWALWGPMRPPVRLLSQHRQKVPTVHEANNIPRNPVGLPARVWLLPRCIPMSHHGCRTKPVQPVVPHLMTGRQATGSVRCASSQHALSPSEQGSFHCSWSSRLDRSGAPGPAATFCVPWQIQVCGSCHPCHGSATAPKHTGFRHTDHRLEKERRKHRTVECVRSHIQAPEKQARENLIRDGS